MTGILAALAGVSPVVVSLNSTSQIVSGGGAATWTFTAVVVSVVGGTPSAYNWTVNQNFGSGVMSILSGQGTNTCTVRVTGCLIGDTNDGLLSCNVTVGGRGYPSPQCDLQYTR